MPYLVAALILIGTLALFDLLLTVAVLRKLRHQAAIIAQYDSVVGSFPDPARLVGQQMPEFSAISLDEELVVGTDLVGRPVLIGFLSVGCAPCHEQAPEFARLAAGEPAGRAGAFAVVCGQFEGSDLVTQLRDVATVVTEPELGPVATAFGIAAFPTFLRVDAAGTVVSASGVVRDLREEALHR